MSVCQSVIDLVLNTKPISAHVLDATVTAVGNLEALADKKLSTIDVTDEYLILDPLYQLLHKFLHNVTERTASHAC